MLEHLSIELVELIASFLDDSSLIAFRFVSRRSCRATYHLFVKRWLTTLTTDFTPQSLRRLSHISRNHDMASRVRCLRIAKCYRRGLGSGPHVPDDEADSFEEQFPRSWSGHIDLDSPQAARLRNMLLRFSNCSEFCLTDEDEDRLWSEASPGRLNPIDICWLLLSLFSGDGNGGKRLEVRRFEVQLDKGPVEEVHGWSPSSEHVHRSLLGRSSWAQTLQQLSMSWQFGHSLFNEVLLPSISSAANLKSLTLSHPRPDDIHAFFTGLACAPPGQSPALSELKLVDCALDSPAAFISAIARVQTTIESIWIERAVLAQDGGIRDVLELLATTTTLELPALRCITVADCYRVFFCPLLSDQRAREQCGGDGLFQFTLGASRNRIRVNGVRYCRSGGGGGGGGVGGDMGLALSALGRACYTLGPPMTDDFGSDAPGASLPLVSSPAGAIAAAAAVARTQAGLVVAKFT
ncbi:uncharacterized protein B0I36DRAFT_311124 [Microdochium trichocladiopsis]|uniref:F-box domain-containing protein n=1 Tax=Microdochium trichocladiopsis TaxID=1682393 RepID=A0A9P8YHR7_9PEZI|nr:uncharacterized protein B0I36DRAFT_311124 [Microdochium trichocladiopsis]KAH7040624.1 hypothetical protein B0I36DRAFT_311124 [Microdochium trichocladiopsis]